MKLTPEQVKKLKEERQNKVTYGSLIKKEKDVRDTKIR